MYYLVLISALLCSCGSPQTSNKPGLKAVEKKGLNLPYRLNEPDHVYPLPPALKEASGLSITTDPNVLLIVQDEEGVLYYFDLETGAISKEIKFFEKGDFEGIEMINEDLIYAVKSSGSLFKIQLKNGVATSSKISTPLNKSYDIEGLCVDAVHKSLYLACKGPGPDSATVTRKVYTYDLQQEVFNEKPFFEITENMMMAYMGANDQSADFLKEGSLHFGPAGIAIHPLTGEIYLLASSGKLLMVLDPQTSRILHIEKIDKKILAQPEGITFDKAGDMFICSEGKKGNPGIIVRYKYHAK